MTETEIVTKSEIAPAAMVPMTIEESSVVRPMPRRSLSHSLQSVSVALPRARRVRFKAGIMLTVGRLLVWLWGFMRFYFGNLFDALLGRASVERRAARLRRAFEGGGATFAKLAQQLSMRADVLPYAYCAELARMLDQAPAFPTEQAIATIERGLGLRLSDVFEVFDPEPIGSASLACVYQARLKNGRGVAVKVRRPGIGSLIAADLRVLDWILIVAETLTIIPPGIARSFRDEFQTILFNEMNFRTEARYTDLFRRRAAKHKKDVTAPRVYFEYCSEEVLVSEFVSGVWMWELMAAVDRNDQEFLSGVARIGIEPKSLARKIVVIMQREMQEELFFHGDPHPANLVIMPNNKICFIDFGAVGRFSTQVRKVLREFQHHSITGDIGRMVNSSLSLLGPLPPLDVERIRYELEKIYADWIYAVHSKDAEWWEKSSAQLWLRFLEVARKFRIAASGEMIQFFRATFSYDTITMRLDKDIDVMSALQAYTRQTAKEARQRVQKSLRRRLLGPTDMDYLRLEQFGDMITQGIFQLQRNIENPIIHFKNIVGKIAYITSGFLKVTYWAVWIFGIGLVASIISKQWFGYEIDWAAILKWITAFGWLQLAVIAAILVIIRRIVIRLSLPDTRLNPER
jgi:ubiquinone biosynthesis protein